MQSLLSISRLAVAAAACALSLQAQCLSSNTGSSIGTGDDTVLPAQALGFSFPFAGQTYTTIHPCTNGFIYLSNGTTTGGAVYPGAIATMVAAPSPMIAPWWSDLNVLAGTGAVKFNALPGKAIITWENAIEYGGSTANGQFTMQLQLYSTGEFDFIYDLRVAVRNSHVFLQGMSPGGGAATPPASDFTTTNISTTDTNFQLSGPTNGPVPHAGTTVHFTPTNPGFVWVPSPCASNVSYGTGCYSISTSIYQLTTAPAVSAATLSNTGVTFVKSPTGYTVINGGSYAPPSGSATVLTLTDDSETTTPTLTAPFPYIGGIASSLMVCSNGIVSVGAGNSTIYSPTAATMLANPQTAFYSWHDFNPAAAGSGQVKFEEVGGIAYITWDGVYNYSGTTAAAASQLQFQLNESNGNVVIAFGTVSSATHTLTAGEPWLVGYSSGGPSSDPGSTTFATGLPATVTEVSPLTLSASPAPVSTPVSGTVVTYTTSNIPEYAPSTGIYIALSILSLGQVPAPGLDLGIIGAPGCASLVATLDYTQAMVGLTNSQSVTLNIPPGLPSGLAIYSQSAALIQPNSLPNGQNAFGLTTSNGIASTIAAQ